MNHVAAHTLNNISLCTGGAGLDLAFELAVPSSRTVCMVEREAHAVAVLGENMAQGVLASAPVWSDVRTFNGRPWRGLVDGVIGGIPCQPYSKAGKMLGEDDERDLWADARRIFVQSGAWYLWIENVEGILSNGGARRVHRDLQRLGCSVEIGLFTASETGASQGRPRVFILAVADTGRPGLPWSEQPGEPGSEEQGFEARAAVAQLRDACAAKSLVCSDGGLLDWRTEEPVGGSEGRIALGWSGPGRFFPPGPNDLAGWREYLDRRPHAEPAVRRGSYGLADGTERIRMLGNGVVPVEGGYALRYVAASLALRGSVGAARLVRMMAA